jgi:hypothetical protein
MTESVTGSADDADDSVPDEGTMPADDASEAELPSDYYVSLQPLTLDLIATQLERVGIKFTRYSDYIGAGWESFTLIIRVLNNDVLSARATFRDPRPASSVAAIIARCNWWNAKRTFLKASAEVITGQAKGDDDSPLTIAIARVLLDMDLPLAAGVAPVQLQSLFRDIHGNIAQFQQDAQLDKLIPPSAWSWK